MVRAPFSTSVVFLPVFKLAVLVENDQVPLNFTGPIRVDPKKCPRANREDAMVFVKRATAADKGQAIIRAFGKDTYGAPLFFPDSVEWSKSAGGRK
jgi:tungstate transport system substrate-binding protein